MCLIILGHRVTQRFPLVIAANRDEDHTRPSRPAAFWDDAPAVLGGRDVRHGGSWLALHASGRFAAVTNLHGAVPARSDARSRGRLVRDFVVGDEQPVPFATNVANQAREFGGFHLLAGEIGGVIAHASSVSADVRELPHGVHGVSNGPPDVRWPKIDAGVARMTRAIHDAVDIDVLADELLSFLTTPGEAVRARGATLREEAEGEVFIVGERYGTRSSTVVISTPDGGLLFIEQNWLAGGVADGGPRRFHVTAQQFAR